MSSWRATVSGGVNKVLHVSAAGHRRRSSQGDLSESGADRQSLERVDGDRCPLPGRACRFHRALPRGGADAANAAPAAVRRGRLQRSPPGSLRRACLSAADDDSAFGAGTGFHRRRIRADRAAPTHAIAGRGGAVASGRCRGVRGAPPPRARHARNLSRQSPARSEPAAIRTSPHRGRDLSRRDMIPDLFEGERRDVPLAPGAIVLAGFAPPFEGRLVAALGRVVERAQFRHMATPGGHRMSVAMTNCGATGWVTDRTGYRYDRHDPESVRLWPAMTYV